MHTLASARSCHHAAIRLTTRHATEFADITDHLDRLVSEARVRVGTLTVQTLHTTTAIVVNEHEPLLLVDFERLLEKTVPQATAYWHDEMPLRPSVAADERRNGHAHCRALLLPSSAVLTIVDGALRLGRWQRVFLAEFDGPRERELSVVILGETAL
jgi:secondary thiamine-phosphate synthase enzyme